MALPKPGDPYVDKYGLVHHDDETGESYEISVEEYQERRKLPLFKYIKPAVERDLKSMPEADEKQQVVLSAIVGMRLMGLDFQDIAYSLNTTEDKIKDMMNEPSAQLTFEAIFKGLINTSADNVHGRISAHSNNAVSVILQLMNNTDTRDDVRLKSAQDILDRSGTNAEQFFSADQQSNIQEDELTINYMSDGNREEKISVSYKRK